MSRNRDYNLVIEDKNDNNVEINDLTFSESLKIIESTLFSNVKSIYVWNEDKLYDKMEFLELINK
jgi:hypothetical protein